MMKGRLEEPNRSSLLLRAIGSQNGRKARVAHHRGTDQLGRPRQLGGIGDRLNQLEVILKPPNYLIGCEPWTAKAAAFTAW